MTRKAVAPEGQLVAAVLQFLTLKGCFAWRNNSGAYKPDNARFVRFGLSGSSDVLAVLPGGKFLAVECKTEVGKTTPLQEAFLAEVRARDGIAVVVRPADWEQILTAVLEAEEARVGRWKRHQPRGVAHRAAGVGE